MTGKQFPQPRSFQSRYRDGETCFQPRSFPVTKSPSVSQSRSVSRSRSVPRHEVFPSHDSEEFEPGTSSPKWREINNIKELDVVVQRKSGQLHQYAISKLIHLLTNSINKDVIHLTRIDFSYYLPDYLRYYNDENGNIFKIGDLIRL